MPRSLLLITLLCPWIAGSQESRIKILPAAEKATGLSILVGTITGNTKLKDKEQPNIRVFLSYSTVGDLNKVKVMPPGNAFTSLLVDVGLKELEENIKTSLGTAGVEGLPSVKRFGYVFGSFPDALGKPQPFLYGLVYDQNGSAEGRAGALPIGAAAAYPLIWWKPNAQGVVELPLQRSAFDKAGQLVV